MMAEWVYHAGCMANRHYRPPELVYKRMAADDNRLKYILYFLDVRDQRVLELGPMEGHHSVILEKMGVREAVAVEGRPDNLSRCLKTKNVFGLDRTTFVCQDVAELAVGAQKPEFDPGFDLVFCLGLLYHLADPGAALSWMLTQSSKLFLGTHVPSGPTRPRSLAYNYRDKTYQGSWIGEDTTKPQAGFVDRQFWPDEPSLLRLLRDCGYDRVDVLGHDVQCGTPHVTILAERTGY